MTIKRSVLVTGATGKQGGAVAQALLDRGHKVIAMTRWPEKAKGLAARGAEVVWGDFNDTNSLAFAMKNADGVFAMSTPFENGMDAEVRQGKLLADAAKAAGIGHYVYTSVVSALRRTGIPHFETKAQIEAHIRGLGLSCTILRPAFFMENFSQDWFLPSIVMGKLKAPMHPDTKLQMIALKDIGEFAAAAFSEPERFLGREIELAGDALTFPEVARKLSEAMGQKVVFEQIPDTQAKSIVGGDFALMYKWFNEEGYHVDIEGLRKAFGIPLTKFNDAVASTWGRVKAAA